MPKVIRSRNTSISVGTTNVVVSEQCFQERKKYNLVNTSTGGQIISIALGQEAQALIGLVLYPGGSTGESKNDVSDLISQEQINAISSAAGGTLAFFEQVIMEAQNG